MNIKEEAVLSLLATCPGEFRNILFARSRVGRPHTTFYDLSGADPKGSAIGLQEALAKAGYSLPDLSNIKSLCFKLLKTVQANKEVTLAVAKMLGDYDPAYGDEGDHPPEEEGRELLQMVQSLRESKLRS